MDDIEFVQTIMQKIHEINVLIKDACDRRTIQVDIDINQEQRIGSFIIRPILSVKISKVLGGN